MSLKVRIASALLFLACSTASATTRTDVVKDSLPKVVTIEVKGFIWDYETDKSTYTVRVPVAVFGAGAFISPDGMVLSCDHLFMHKFEDQQIIVKTGSGKKYRAILLSEDAKKDLSLIKVFPLHPVPFFERGKPVARGQEVYAFGAPLLYEKSVSVGYVENLAIGEGKYTLHSAAINPGNSGGPLVSDDGKLVGVNVSHLLVNIFMRAEGMGQAVSLHDVNMFLKD